MKLLFYSTVLKWRTTVLPYQTQDSQSSFLFSWVAPLCPAFCNPTDCSTPGFPVHHQLPELAQNHVHWVGDAIQSSHLRPFPSYLQSFPASGSFPMRQVFGSGGWSIGASASASVLPMEILDWSPLGLIGLISLQSKGLWRVFSNTTVQKHQFFGSPLSWWSNSNIHTWLLLEGPKTYLLNLK